MEQGPRQEATPQATPTLGGPRTEVVREGCRQYGDGEKALADAIETAAKTWVPGDEAQAERQAQALIDEHNRKLAAERGEKIDVTFGNCRPVLKIRFHDGLGGRWGFNVMGDMGKYVALAPIIRPHARPQPTPETPAVRGSVLKRLLGILF